MTLLNIMAISNQERQKVVDDYLQKLAAAPKAHRTERVLLVNGSIDLHCFTLNNSVKLPSGFTMSVSQSGKENLNYDQLSFQYDLRSVEGARCRPKANRVVFFNNAEAFCDKALTVSHLCHNSWCMNPKHFVLETLAENKGRNGCPGPPHCFHGSKCLRPGPFYDSGGLAVSSRHVDQFQL